MKAKARVPFERTWELERERLDLGVAEAWIEDERLHIASKPKGTMNVRLDVVVEAIPLIGCGEVDRTHSSRRTERRRVEAGIGIADCAALRGSRPQPVYDPSLIQRARR